MYKLELLNRFRDDGFFLMDAVEYPINTKEFIAEEEIEINKLRFLDRVTELRNEGKFTTNTKTILIKQSVYNVHKDSTELQVLNNNFIGFPYWCNNENIAKQIKKLLEPYYMKQFPPNLN